MAHETMSRERERELLSKTGFWHKTLSMTVKWHRRAREGGGRHAVHLQSGLFELKYDLGETEESDNCCFVNEVTFLIFSDQ